jgi:hypothetical protein
MLPELVLALAARRPQTRERWEALLRTERPTSPLANPDSLVHLTDWALNEILGSLNLPGDAAARPAAKGADPQCACGRNPYLAFFLAGEQALLEALVLSQAAQPTLIPVERDEAVAELGAVLQRVRHREVEAFCALCQHRQAALTAAATLGAGPTAG